MQSKLAIGVVTVLMIGSGVACGPTDYGDLDGGSLSPQADARNSSDEFVDAEVCAAETVDAEQVVLPVDIIWAVDTSRSMEYETSMVESNLNSFAAQIDSWGIDYHVIMVAERGSGSNQVCVPPPLGGANCANGDRYMHVPTAVASHDALQKLIEAYPSYQSFLREDSIKHFVVVSDDEAEASDNDIWFRNAIAALSAPGFPANSAAPEGYIFDSIVAWGDVADIGCSTGAAIGQSYLNLTTLTGGVKAKVCETDWTPIFNALQDAVAEGSQLPCNFALPAPPEGEQLNTDEVNVAYTPAGGTETILPRVDSASECGSALGWYYDDPSSPSQIVVCPAACDLFTSGDGSVDLAFGCATVVL